MSTAGGEQGPHPLELELDQVRAERDRLALELEQARALGFEVTKERNHHQEQAQAWKATAEVYLETITAARLGDLQKRSDANAEEVLRLQGLIELAWNERDAARADQLAAQGGLREAQDAAAQAVNELLEARRHVAALLGQIERARRR